MTLVIIIVLIDDCHSVRLLQELNIEIPEDIRDWILGALIIRIRKRAASQRSLAALAQKLGGVWFQDWAAVIADQLIEVARSRWQPRAVGDRTRTRERRPKAQRRVSPDARKIRNG